MNKIIKGCLIAFVGEASKESFLHDRLLINSLSELRKFLNFSIIIVFKNRHF